MIHNVVENIYTLYIENEQIHSTGIHRFYIKRNNDFKWIAAEQLTTQDQVLFGDGSWHIIQRIEINMESTIVYNFEVSNTHNYYVGINRILVHNKRRSGSGRRGGGGTLLPLRLRRDPPGGGRDQDPPEKGRPDPPVLHHLRRRDLRSGGLRRGVRFEF